MSKSKVSAIEIAAPNQYFKEDSELQNDQVFVEVSKEKLADITGMPVSSKFSHAIVCEGKIVNVVSANYGLVDNRKYFYDIEDKLINAGIEYQTRSINRDNRHFAVDYILNDETYAINVKEGGDIIKPMLRFTNSYAGAPTSGSFGFFRKVCDNGLHVAKTKIGFKVRHKANVNEIVFPNIKDLVLKFMDNEFYSLHKKIQGAGRNSYHRPVRLRSLHLQ